MSETIIQDNENLIDVIPLFVGGEQCEPKHKFGPYVRDYFLIHFVYKGYGTLYDKYGAHKIEKGKLFIIREGEATTYIADEKEPWEYVWIAFKGTCVKHFAVERSVFPCPDDLMRRLYDYVQEGYSSASIYSSIIYELVFCLFSQNRNSDINASKMKQYINYNYMKNELSVNDIAKTFGFERSYLFRLFKKSYGCGIKEYIVNVRMEWAKRFLAKGYSVSDTAFMVGYNDEFNFSKIFKKLIGMPPIEYKKQTQRSVDL